MQSNATKSVVLRPRTSAVRSATGTKLAHTRKVGYSWNKGGRLRELRIRHLARKFLNIWIQNTFGRILPHKAKSHCESVILRRVFDGWRDEWWTSRREWSLTIQAECHYRYYLYSWTFNSWRTFVSLQREKKAKIKNAQSFADRHTMHLVWERWEVFTEMRRIKSRMAETAHQHNRLATLNSAWRLWQTRLRHLQDLQTLENEVLRQQTVTLQHKVWICWKKMHTLACHNRENECKASLHFIIRLKRKALQLWISYVSYRKIKIKSKAVAQHACYLRLLGMCWNKWNHALYHKWSEEARTESAGHLARHSTQRRMLEHWKAYVVLCREKAENNLRAYEHHNHHLLRAGLCGLSLNSQLNKMHQLNNNVAVLHCSQTIIRKYWKLWQERLEEAGDKSFQSPTEKAMKTFSASLSSSSFHHWKQTLAELRHMQFVQKLRVKKSRVEQMHHYHEAKLLKRTFDAWKKHHVQMSDVCAQAEELYREQTQSFLRSVLLLWNENADLQAVLREKEQQAQDHCQHFLQLKVFAAWREATSCAVTKRHQQMATVSRIQHSINQEHLLQFFRQWRNQTREARRLRIFMEKARRHHEAKVLSKALTAWNKHHQQCQKYKVMKRQGILLLRLRMWQTFFDQWKVKLQYRRREAKQTEQALWHWSLTLQSKVLLGWRQWVIEQRRKQEEAARAAQVYRDQLPREGVTCILTYAAHVNNRMTSLTQHTEEQRVVPRCAMQCALCKPDRKQEIEGQSQKKSVTFCLNETKNDCQSSSLEKEEENGLLNKRLLKHTPQLQPRCHEELLESLPTVMPHKSIHKHSSVINTRTAAEPLGLSSSPDPVTAGHLTVPHPECLMSTLDSTLETRSLLPPSAFMTTLGTTTHLGLGYPPLVSSNQHAPLFKLHSLHPVCEKSKDVNVNMVVTDSASALTKELLSIKQDMKRYQQNKKQLRAWHKLKDLLETWLQTSGKDDQTERNAVCQELEELKERIDRLAAELAKEKPVMLLHTDRIHRLQTALQTSGVSLSNQQKRLEQFDPCLEHDEK